ncbi:class A beta-lactamase-related serine hydrolase [Halioglobus maricola]|uniref:Class A beta-lactamase-related serine hydrolase n=1 Tax=Halioglobus maricola TaxID=2601894 RepID=A0A5P9NNY9_9GAMM|nr:serine hydrolase domain-containing protein [Halioglobus maricola]QFU76618.1 class A beta-lactamase-related serine hydrolase [Halioglobus maricola]
MIKTNRVIQALSAAIITALAPLSFAQGVTIGGTASDSEATGVMALFSGDRYENFRHMERFVPTSAMTASPQPWKLGENSASLRFVGEMDGEPMDVNAFVEHSGTSSLLVIHDGKVIYEHYGHGDTADSLHISFSVAKSFTSTLVGIALAEGAIESLDDPIRKYLPELTSATFDDVTVKHILQMSSGVRFNETYTDPNSDINRMTAMVPPMSYLEYINTLGRAQAPGKFNHYASINTQLLGLLLARTTGETMTDYMQEKLWHPLGMESQGLWMLDAQGHEFAMGGLAATARDYAKLGLLYLDHGKRGDKQIVPASWVKAAVTPDEPHLMPGKNPGSSNTSGYQYQWWTPRDWDGDFLARGIWGQSIYVHPGNRVVIVRLAANARNFEPAHKLANIDYLQDLAQSLTD